MTIESNQIHNVVCTYQQAIHLLPSAWQDAERMKHVEEGQISISSHARESGVIHLTDEVQSLAT